MESDLNVAVSRSAPSPSLLGHDSRCESSNGKAMGSEVGAYFLGGKHGSRLHGELISRLPLKMS